MYPQISSALKHVEKIHTDLRMGVDYEDPYEHPPTLVGKKYSQWKNEVEIWQLVTELSRNKQGLALALSLEGEARKVAVALPIDVLSADNGVQEIIRRIGKLYDEVQNNETEKMAEKPRAHPDMAFISMFNAY